MTKKRCGIIKSLLESPKPPCETPDRCEYFTRCAKNELACSSYAWYVVHEGAINPNLKRVPNKWSFAAVMHDSRTIQMDMDDWKSDKPEETT